MAKLIAIAALILSASNLVSCAAVPEVLTKRGETVCEHTTLPGGSTKVDLVDVQWCLQYIQGLHGSDCGAVRTPTSSPWRNLCSHGSVSVDVASQEDTHTQCQDVAPAIMWVRDNCREGNEVNIGHAPASGKESLVVYTQFNDLL